jgi:hypothetical protein
MHSFELSRCPGCAVVLTAGACGDALELQMQLKVGNCWSLRPAPMEMIFCLQERFVTHLAAVASCEICELFLEGDAG